ncbi:hypothetical protein DW960_10135 [Ruminococcus bromii]|nr:hypothetical protein DW960_10135 [Ruminococcus bromii]
MFVDWNDRTLQWIMNYQFIEIIFLPVLINKKDELEYFNFFKSMQLMEEI